MDDAPAGLFAVMSAMVAMTLRVVRSKFDHLDRDVQVAITRLMES